MSQFSEVAYGSYEGCEKCGSSELIFGIGWHCICDLLIANGNCKNCMYGPEYCICPNGPEVIEIENQAEEGHSDKAQSDE